MHSQRFLRSILTLALSLCVLVAACSPATLANHAESVGKYALKTKPVFQVLIESGAITDNGILARIDQINRDTKILADALRTGVNTTILTATAAVINGIEALIEQDAELIKDLKLKAKVIGFLTAAEIAIGIITDSFPNTHHALAYLTQEQQKAVETIKKFKAKVKCRVVGKGVKKPDGSGDYSVGVWAKMETCKKFPDQTVVERVKK